MSSPVLNLGCGNDFRGDIRIDLKPNKAAVNLVADAHYLPLREKTIRSTLCKSVLEHVESPYKVMIEIKRITRGNIIIITPNIYNLIRILRNLFQPMRNVSPKTLHLQGWDIQLMKHLGNLTGLNVESFTWFAKDPRKLSLIFKPLFSTHLVTTFKDIE